VPVGYETNKVMTAAIFGNFSRNTTAADAARVNTDILDRLRASPGVVSAAVTSAVPMASLNPQRQAIRIEARTTPEGAAMLVNPNTASPGYFETLSVPVLAGRTFRDGDSADAPIVAVINQQMAQLWSGVDPVGSRFKVDTPLPAGAPPRPWITVVGVVRDFRLYNVDQPVEPQYYLSYVQSGGFGGRLLVRTNGNAADLIPTIKAAVHAVDGQIPVEELLTLEELREGRLRSPELTAALLTMFAGVALVITVAGLAGIIATSVSQRTREFGLRMALGATRGSVLQLVLRQGVLLVALGLAIGVGGAWAFSQLIRRYLFATQTTDVAAYAAVAGVFLVAALVAAIGPARRATSIDPLIALKAE
jgi:putative ABC transport system permease protein